MSATAVRILFVGSSTASAQSTLNELARSGWESHSVQTLQEADSVLRTIRFHLTLATEKLADGTGYGLVSAVERQGGNLFISVPLSETCLWLPAVETGQQIAGRARAESGSVRDRSGKHPAEAIRALHGSVARWRRSLCGKYGGGLSVARRPSNEALRRQPTQLHHA